MIRFDKATVIEKFKSSAWTEKAQACLKMPDSLKKISDDLSGYMNKDGLKSVKGELTQLLFQTLGDKIDNLVGEIEQRKTESLESMKHFG